MNKSYKYVEVEQSRGLTEAIEYTPINDWHCFIMTEDPSNIDAGIPTPRCFERYHDESEESCRYCQGFRVWDGYPHLNEKERNKTFLCRCSAPLIKE